MSETAHTICVPHGYSSGTGERGEYGSPYAAVDLLRSRELNSGGIQVPSGPAAGVTVELLQELYAQYRYGATGGF